MEPGLETIGIAKRSQLAPGHDEGGLNGVLGPVGVAQDPARDRHAPIADHAGEGVEGLLVAPLRLVHEISVHPFLLAPRRVRLDVSHGRESCPCRRFNLGAAALLLAAPGRLPCPRNRECAGCALRMRR